MHVRCNDLNDRTQGGNSGLNILLAPLVSQRACRGPREEVCLAFSCLEHLLWNSAACFHVCVAGTRAPRRSAHCGAFYVAWPDTAHAAHAPGPGRCRRLRAREPRRRPARARLAPICGRLQPASVRAGVRRESGVRRCRLELRESMLSLRRKPTARAPLRGLHLLVDPARAMAVVQRGAHRRHNVLPAGLRAQQLNVQGRVRSRGTGSLLLADQRQAAMHDARANGHVALPRRIREGAQRPATQQASAAAARGPSPPLPPHLRMQPATPTRGVCRHCQDARVRRRSVVLWPLPARLGAARPASHCQGGAQLLSDSQRTALPTVPQAGRGPACALLGVLRSCRGHAREARACRCHASW